MKKEYEMPNDIKDMWFKWSATEQVIDKLIKIPFCLNKAIKLKYKNNKFRHVIYNKIWEIYPELEGIECRVDWNTSMIYVKTIPPLQVETGEVSQVRNKNKKNDSITSKK